MRMLVVTLVMVSSPVFAQDVQRVPRNPLTEEEKKFSQEFSALLEKYPVAAHRFHLADFGISRSVAAWTPSIYECDRFDIPDFGQWVECHVAEPR